MTSPTWLSSEMIGPIGGAARCALNCSAICRSTSVMLIWSCLVRPDARWYTRIAVVDSMPVNFWYRSLTPVASAPAGR